jgi:hypothetical protein
MKKEALWFRTNNYSLWVFMYTGQQQLQLVPSGFCGGLLATTPKRDGLQVALHVVTRGLPRLFTARIACSRPSIQL